MPKIGSLIYSCDSGLGILAKAFVDHGIINKPFVVLHPSHPSHAWHSGAPETPIRPLDLPAIREWLRGLDVFLAIETPFWWEAFAFCRQHHVKTVFMPMYECFPRQYMDDPAYWPDLFLCPSELDTQVFAGGSARRAPGCLYYSHPGGRLKTASYLPVSVKVPGRRAVCYLPVPVDVPWRQRTRAEVFVHNAGNGSFNDRNGTRVLLDSLKYAKNRLRLILRGQSGLLKNQHPLLQALGTIQEGNVTIDFRPGTWPYETLWDEGDAFVFCERWNGLCLPLQEARAAGMFVIAGDRFPVNTWLPPDGLVRPASYSEDGIGGPYNRVNAANYDPRDVAAMIDRVYGTDIRAYSESGREWAESMSWERWKPEYLKVLTP